MDEVTRLKQQPGEDILVFGSATLVELLMKAELVDEYRFLVHPTFMGSGKRFFSAGMVEEETDPCQNQNTQPGRHSGQLSARKELSNSG